MVGFLFLSTDVKPEANFDELQKAYENFLTICDQMEECFVIINFIILDPIVHIDKVMEF